MFAGNYLARDVLSALSIQQQSQTLIQSVYYYHYYKHYLGYILRDATSNQLIAIDCGDYKSCRFNIDNIIKETGADFTHIFLTHNHQKHIEGIIQWKAIHPNLKIIGGFDNGLIEQVQPNQIIHIGNLSIFCLHTPGHCDSSISYVITDVSESSNKLPIAFTGDTLFISGCGKCEDAEKMFNSLNLLKNLPNETTIFPGHDNGLKNLTICKMYEPSNEFLNAKLKQAQEGTLQIGSLIAEERLYNPYLRCNTQYLKKLTKESDPIKVFKKLKILEEKLVL